MFKVLDFAFPQSKEIAGIASTQSLEKKKLIAKQKNLKRC